MNDINRKMAKGAAWMVLFKLVERSIGLVSTIVLARLLVPADFGLIAMSASIYAVLELMGAFSFDVSLIHNQQAGRAHYDTAWTFNVMFGAVSALVLVAIAVPMSQFYNEPRLEAILYVYAVAAFAQGLENIGVVAFRKELQMGKEFRFLTAKKLIGFAVTMILAFTLRSYWALVFGALSQRLTGIALSYALHPYRPRLSLAARHELFHFSKWLLVNNLIYFLNQRSGDFIIGKVAGPHALGLFSISYEISNLPTTELVAPINRAVFPGYARLAGDLAELRQGFLNVISMIALLTMPAGAGIAAVSEPLVFVMLGEKWAAAADLIRVMALYGIVVSLQSNTVSAYMALGKPKIVTLTNGMQVAILIPALVWSAGRWGAIGAAWALVVSVVIVIPVVYSVLFRSLNLAMKDYVGAIWRPVIGTITMCLAAYLIQHGWDLRNVSRSLFDTSLLLGAVVISGAFTYILVVLGLWSFSGKPEGAEKYVLRKLQLALIKSENRSG